MTHSQFTICDLRLLLVVVITALSSFPIQAAPKKPAPIISANRDGHLIYDADELGNRVPDFSSCGYAGGDREMPIAPVRIVVSPVNGDETERIQRAIDYVGSLPADTNGLRGAVLLLKGRHEVSGSLLITNSGVVLRGQGAGENGTILVASGLDRRTLIRIFGVNDRVSHKSESWEITEGYVPVGATKLHLKSVGELKVGDSIRVVRPSTQAWIDLLGANDFGGGEGGGWKPGQYDIVWNRKIKSIETNAVTIDAPITTALDAQFGGGWVETYSWPGRIHDVGVENLCLESTFDAANPRDENHSWFAITMENTTDAWVRQVDFKHFAGSAVALYESCRRMVARAAALRGTVARALAATGEPHGRAAARRPLPKPARTTGNPPS